MTSKRDPREEVHPNGGQGGYGKDFGPKDREYQDIRRKARGVMDGRQKFSNDELQRIMARFLIER